MEENLNLSWGCQHNTVERTTTYEFGNGYQIIQNDNTKMAYKLKDGETKDSFSIDGMHVDHWTNLVTNFAKQANERRN